MTNNINPVYPEYVQLVEESNIAKDKLNILKEDLEEEMHSVFIGYGDTIELEKDIKALEKAIKVLNKYYK